MREFFHGWRRKAGCVALVMVCALAGMWMRSFIVNDQLWIGRHWFESHRGEIDWRYFSNVNPLEWRSRQIKTGLAGLLRSYSGPSYQAIASISYWSLTVPLTILSASLILWKPRKRKAVSDA
ncbi:MAG: hypothetical protein WCJ09_26945 [Planctomycetota bacterium]